MMDNEIGLYADFYKADELIKENKITEAKQILESILLKDDNFFKAHNHLGWIYHAKIKDYKSAELHYLKAMKLDSNYTASFINYSNMLLIQRRFNELKPHLDLVIKIPGIDKSNVYNDYGTMYELEDNCREAVKYYKLANKFSWDSKTKSTQTLNINRCKTKSGFFKSLFW